MNAANDFEMILNQQHNFSFKAGLMDYGNW